MTTVVQAADTPFDILQKARAAWAMREYHDVEEPVMAPYRRRLQVMIREARAALAELERIGNHSCSFGLADDESHYLRCPVCGADGNA